MQIDYKNLELPSEGEISLADVVEQLKIPRRTVLSYIDVFGDFLPNAVRKPPLNMPFKRGRRRILFFEQSAVDILPTIRDLSRRRLPHDEIRGILIASKGQIISTRTKEKIAPFIEVLKERENSFPGLSKLPEDFDFAPFAQGVKVVEDEFGVWLPVVVKQVGEDRFEKILFLINALFLFHLQESLHGSELEFRIRKYLEGVHATTEEEKKLRDWLGEMLGLAGRWSRKNRFVVDQLTYELVGYGGMSFISVRELFETCHKRILVTYLVNMPVVGVPEIKKSWLLLLSVVFARRGLLVKSEVTDVVIDIIVSDWKKRWEDGIGSNI